MKFERPLALITAALLATGCGPGEWNGHYDPQHPAGNRPVPTLAPEHYEIDWGTTKGEAQDIVDALAGENTNSLTQPQSDVDPAVPSHTCPDGVIVSDPSLC